MMGASSSTSSTSSTSSSTLINCCICLSQMKEPIKTLPCLHSSCSSCIDELVSRSAKPFRCPLCRSVFEIPEIGPEQGENAAPAPASAAKTSPLQPNYFTSFLLSLAEAASSYAGLDPNNIACEICEEDSAEEYCRDCGQFFCVGCKGLHLKTKLTCKHEFVSLEDGLRIKEGTYAASPARLPRCHIHPQQEVNSYCDKCKESCCAECSVDNHSDHKIVRLATVSLNFKQNITTLMDRVGNYEKDLSRTIQETADTLKALREQSNLAEGHVQRLFSKLRSLLDEREAELMGMIEKERHQKEKKLMLQKDELEFFLTGVRDSLRFSEKLVKEGSGVEIATSHKSVTARFETLVSVMATTQLTPVTSQAVDLIGEKKGVDDARRLVKNIGKIFTQDISAKHSSFSRGDTAGNGLLLLPQECHLNVTLMTANGAQVSNEYGPSVQVTVGGPSKDVVVEYRDTTGTGTGKQTPYYTLNQAGEHEISVLANGKHFPGSPFTIHAIRRFGWNGSSDGAFSQPSGVASNSRGEIIVADRGNHRIQVFDPAGKLLFQFGSNGIADGQLSGPQGVAVNRRSNNQIVVADTNNHRIQIFDEKGQFLSSFGSLGNGEGQLSSPYGIAVDQAKGNYFVSDYNNHRVQVFNSKGFFLKVIGSSGTGDGQFQRPLGLGLMSNGFLVVSENSRQRLQLFDAAGNFVSAITGFGQPWHLAIDREDLIVVADYGNGRVLVFDANGKNLKTLASGQLMNPTGVCVDPEGRMIVCENSGHRVTVM